MLTRSSSHGDTWDKPYFAPDFDWSGVDPPGLSQLRDSTVVFTQFRFGWYPLGLSKKRRAAGEPVSISLPRKGWTEDFTDEELRDSPGHLFVCYYGQRLDGVTCIQGTHVTIES